MSQSVEAAVQRLDFQPYAGRTAFVEVNGLFTHTHRDYLDFVQGAVEARLTAAGVRVRPFDLALLQTISEDTEHGYGLAEAVPAPSGPSGAGGTTSRPVTVRVRPEADLRIVVNVAYGGVDRASRREVDAARAVGEGAGLGVGTILMAVAPTTTDAVAPLLVSGALGVVGAVLGFVFAPPTRTYERVSGRVRIVVNAIPQIEGLAGSVQTAEGSMTVDADPNASETAEIN